MKLLVQLASFGLLVALTVAQEGPTIDATTLDPNDIDNITDLLPELKQGVGKGYGGHGGGYHHENHHHDFIPPFRDERPFFDTHYCSVHGSFALSFSKNDQYSHKHNPYGNHEAGGYGPRHHHKRERKYIREYCRFSAAFSHEACKFCCKIVARSAFTNPDDIISAIFGFDPARPTSGGNGLPNQEHKHEGGHGHHDGGYGHREGGYGHNEGGYGRPEQGYGHQQQGYGQQHHEAGYGRQEGGYGHQQGGYGRPEGGYGHQQGGYRAKRQNTGQPPAPPPQPQGGPVGAPPAPPPSGPLDPVSAGFIAPQQAPEEPYEFAPVNQCVCCAPKSHHRY